MIDTKMIIQCIDDWLENNQKEYMLALEANKLLEGEGLLSDNLECPGKPLRKLLRAKKIPHAYQVGVQWRIPHSGSKISEKVKPSDKFKLDVNLEKFKTMNTIKTKTLAKENQYTVECLPPIADENSKFLILGTMPGAESLKRNEYYAAKGNCFWRVIENLFNNGKSFASYEEKKCCLLRNHIALWDVYKSCERKGSADDAIKHEIPNDIPSFLKKHSLIKKIIFNGNKAARTYNIGIQTEIAPSTSGANTHSTFDEKVEEWRKIIK